MTTFLVSSEAFKIITTTTTEVLVVLNTYKDYSSSMFCWQGMKNTPVAEVTLSRHLEKTGKFDKRCKRKFEKMMLN